MVHGSVQMFDSSFGSDAQKSCGVLQVAIPTSIGYGASLGGMSALLSSLSSCSSGITVVNVDNGMGAAFAAARMLRTADRIIESRSRQSMISVVGEGDAIGVVGNGRNGNGANAALGQGETAGLDSPSGNGNGPEGRGVEHDSIDAKMLTRKIGKPLLGLLIFQTGALLPKLVPLGIDATSMLT